MSENERLSFSVCVVFLSQILTGGGVAGGWPGAAGGDRRRPGWPGLAAGGRGPAGEGKVWFRVHKTILWDTAADPADPAESPEVVSATAARSHPSHAPGARMT